METYGERARRFPLGAAVTAEALADDPYPVYARLREREPVSWVGALGMYLVVSHAQVERILLDPRRFIVGTEHSLLSLQPGTFERVRADAALITALVDETIRWAGPVQSATRHVAVDTEFDGVEFRAGDTVNCMLAAANRDPANFADPDRFDIDRKGLRGHLGFATGPHHCLGTNLARLEGRIALERLLTRLPRCRVERPEESRPYGGEFRQPRRLQLAWG